MISGSVTDAAKRERLKLFPLRVRGVSERLRAGAFEVFVDLVMGGTGAHRFGASLGRFWVVRAARLSRAGSR